MKHEILIVDDERTLLKSLAAVLTDAGYAVRTAQDGEQALHAVKSKRPSLVLLDVSMPGKSGLEVCRELRNADPALPIVFLTALETPADELKGLASGGDAYIPKTTDDEVLLARIAAILRPRDDQFADDGNFFFDSWFVEPGRHQMTAGKGQPVVLSEREIGALKFFVDNPNEVFSYHSLYTRLWGTSDGYLENTIRAFISRLRKKLKRSERLIEAVYGVGYSYRPQD